VMEGEGFCSLYIFLMYMAKHLVLVSRLTVSNKIGKSFEQVSD
jgi:hypothetical protein